MQLGVALKYPVFNVTLQVDPDLVPTDETIPSELLLTEEPPLLQTNFAVPIFTGVVLLPKIALPKLYGWLMGSNSMLVGPEDQVPAVVSEMRSLPISLTGREV